MNHRMRTTVQAALCTALLCLLAQVTIPMPSGVPITLQTFAVALAGYCQDPKRAALSVTAYLLLGLVGVPVFSAMQGGIGVFAGPTGGFLIGFVPFAVLCALAAAAPHIGWTIVLSVAGLACCHACGVVWFSVVAKAALGRAFLLVSAPYLIKDAASVLVAYLLARAVRKALARSEQKA